MITNTTIAELKERRAALDEQIAEWEALEYLDAVEMVRAFAAEHGLTKDDIFPDPTKARLVSEMEFGPDPIDGDDDDLQFAIRLRQNRPGPRRVQVRDTDSI